MKIVEFDFIDKKNLTSFPGPFLKPGNRPCQRGRKETTVRDYRFSVIRDTVLGHLVCWEINKMFFIYL